MGTVINGHLILSHSVFLSLLSLVTFHQFLVSTQACEHLFVLLFLVTPPFSVSPVCVPLSLLSSVAPFLSTNVTLPAFSLQICSVSLPALVSSEMWDSWIENEKKPKLSEAHDGSIQCASQEWLFCEVLGPNYVWWAQFSDTSFSFYELDLLVQPIRCDMGPDTALH